jgi:hypothetical protein
MAQSIRVRCSLASLPVPFISDFIVHYCVREFAGIIATYNNNVHPHVTRLQGTQTHHDICTHILKAVILPCISRYNVGDTDSNFVQELLIKLLYVIPNIKALVLPSVQSPNYMQLIIQRIQVLTRLQEFRFHIGCTTEVITELSKHCPNLKDLSVQYSKGVGDTCVEHLLKLRRLRTVNVADTSVSNNSYKTLLFGLPEVQHVVWFDSIDPVLRNLSEPLHSVRKFVGNISDAKLLVQNCPEVTELVLLSLTKDISVMGELRSVTGLSMLLSNCTVVRFSACISRLGRTLTKLDLYQVVNVNMDDLIKYCVVLNSLLISYCHVTFAETRYRELPHFLNLTQLRLMQNWGPCDFSSLLHLYINLNVLHVVGMGNITDAFIAQIITAGGLRNVTEFIAEHCGRLSIETAWLLLHSCPHLTEIGNIKSWSGFVNNELVAFLNFVKCNNLSLTVSS